MLNEIEDWNKVKKSLAAGGYEELFFHERDVWWCSLGINLGDEQNGKNDKFERPVLVIRKFNHRIAWVLPASSKKKIGPHYHQMTGKDFSSTIILSQIRLVSVKRFRRFMCKISEEDFSVVKNKLISLLINKTSD